MLSNIVKQFLLSQSDTGADAANVANDLIGERSDAEAVFWYGAYSFIVSGSALVLWVLFNETTWINGSNGSYAFWYNRMEFYLPVGMAWLMVSFFDSELMREIFADICTISVLGSWLFQWRIFVDWVFGNQGNYTNLWFYLWTATYFAWTVAEQVLQIILLP